MSNINSGKNIGGIFSRGCGFGDADKDRGNTSFSGKKTHRPTDEEAQDIIWRSTINMLEPIYEIMCLPRLNGCNY